MLTIWVLAAEQALLRYWSSLIVAVALVLRCYLGGPGQAYSSNLQYRRSTLLRRVHQSAANCRREDMCFRHEGSSEYIGNVSRLGQWSTYHLHQCWHCAVQRTLRPACYSGLDIECQWKSRSEGHPHSIAQSLEKFTDYFPLFYKYKIKLINDGRLLL